MGREIDSELERISANATEAAVFDVRVRTSSLPYYYPPIKEFNELMLGGTDPEGYEDPEEPLFGEHLKEAKEVLTEMIQEVRNKKPSR